MLTLQHRGKPHNRPLLVGSVLLHQHWSSLLPPWLIPRSVLVELPPYSPLGTVPLVFKALRSCRSSSVPFAQLRSAFRHPFGLPPLLSISRQTPGGTTKFFQPKLVKLLLAAPAKPLQVPLLRARPRQAISSAPAVSVTAKSSPPPPYEVALADSTARAFARHKCAVLSVVVLAAQSSAYGVSDGEPSCIIGGVC